MWERRWGDVGGWGVGWKTLFPSPLSQQSVLLSQPSAPLALSQQRKPSRHCAAGEAASRAARSLGLTEASAWVSMNLRGRGETVKCWNGQSFDHVAKALTSVGRAWVPMNLRWGGGSDHWLPKPLTSVA